MDGLIQKKLFALQDLDYRDFQCKLMPTVPPEQVIGVRMPALRKLAKEVRGKPETAEFLTVLPHNYYEENNLHGLLISESRDYEETLAALADFFDTSVDGLLGYEMQDNRRPAICWRQRHFSAIRKPFPDRFRLG